MKKCKDFALDFRENRMTMHHLTLPFFTKKKHDCHPPPILHFPLSPIEDTTEVMEAESQVVLNTLTEHKFQVAFKKNGRSYGNTAYMRKTTSRPMAASRPKVSF
jgi:hypothetical protein